MSQSPAADPQSHGARLLDTGDAVLTELQQTLQAEREALIGREAAELAAIVARKDALIARLEDLQRELLADAPFAVWLSTLPADAQVERRAQRQRLRVALTNCQRENQVNGAIVRRAMQATRHVLGVLTGERNDSTYGADGRGDDNASQRTLARA